MFPCFLCHHHRLSVFIFLCLSPTIQTVSLSSNTKDGVIRHHFSVFDFEAPKFFCSVRQVVFNRSLLLEHGQVFVLQRCPSNVCPSYRGLSMRKTAGTCESVRLKRYPFYGMSVLRGLTIKSNMLFISSLMSDSGERMVRMSSDLKWTLEKKLSKGIKLI